MSKMISLRDANQGFSRCIREVEAGEEFIITRNGSPVAKLIPLPQQRVFTPEQQAARARALARMRQGWDLGIERPFNRDEIYAERLDRYDSKRQC